MSTNLALRFTPRPMPRMIRRVLLLMFCCGVLLTLVYGLLLDSPEIGGSGSSIRQDHQLHVVTFFVLTVISSAFWSPAGLVAGVMVASGGVLELAQWLCGRHMSLGDWAASSAGVALGMFLFGPAVRHVVVGVSCYLIGRLAAVDRPTRTDE